MKSPASSMKPLLGPGLLALLFLASTATQAAAGADYMIVNLLWPGNKCRVNKCCVLPWVDQPAHDFLVQSVDIYDADTGNIVSNCDSSCYFMINPLYDLIDQLYAYWPSLACPAQNGYDLWKNAWCGSGNCTGLEEIDFFNRTLHLRAKADPLHTLGSAGIVPSDSKVYDLDDIEEALLIKLGFSTVVECDKSTGALARIRLCASIDGKSLVTCPFSRESKYCGSTVKFRRFKYNMLGGTGSEGAIELPSDGVAAH